MAQLGRLRQIEGALVDVTCTRHGGDLRIDQLHRPTSAAQFREDAPEFLRSRVETEQRPARPQSHPEKMQQRFLTVLFRSDVVFRSAKGGLPWYPVSSTMKFERG
jgi:hypothetical protein